MSLIFLIVFMVGLLAGWVMRWTTEPTAIDLARLEDENSVLRAALQQFVDMPDRFPENEFLDGFSRMRAAFANARSVLNLSP